MPLRQVETDVRDDFLVNYNVDDTDRLSEHIILLRPPPQRLLYICGLTTDCRHPKLAQVIKDLEGQGNKCDRVLLSVNNGTVVSKGEPIPNYQRLSVRTTPPLAMRALIPEKIPLQRSVEKPNDKIVAAREKKGAQAIAKIQAKRAGEGSSTVPHKKKARKNYKPTGLKSEGTNSFTLIHQANPKPLNETTKPQEYREHFPDEERVERGNSQEELVFFDDNDEYAEQHRFVPGWGLRKNLRISSYRACKELISHLATPVEDKVLSSLTNYEVVRCTCQSLGQSLLSQDKMLKRHEQLNREHVDLERELMDRLKDMERERDDWRQTASDQEKTELVRELAQAEIARHKIVQEFIPTVMSRIHFSVEY
nr:hypothetical protein [Tanacetum cinerariifolium]